MFPDLPAYTRRIAYTGPLVPALDTLRQLHFAHATHIAFENIDCVLRRPISLDLPSLCTKLIDSRRGGYCHEQNALFAAVLECIGFRVTRLAARVLLGGLTRPRTHMLLLIETGDADDVPHLADVGFGAEGLLHPIALRPDEVSTQFAWRYRLHQESGRWILQSGASAEWSDLYAFTLDPQEAADYEMATWFTSTHPRSPFLKNLIVMRPGPDRRLRLTNRTFAEITSARTNEAILADDAAVLDVLARHFDIHLPADTRFPNTDSGATR